MVTKALNYKVTRGAALEVVFRQQERETERKKKATFLIRFEHFPLVKMCFFKRHGHLWM